MPPFKLFAALAFVLAQLGFAALAQFPPSPLVKLAVDPVANKLYIANGDDNTVTAFDVGTGVSTTIPVGRGASFIAVNPVTSRVFVNNGRDASLTVINGATNAVLGTYPVGSTGPISINPVTNVVYIVRLTGTGSDEVTFFDDTNTTWYSIATESFQPNAMAVNPVTNKIYIAHYATGDVRVISGVYNPGDAFPATTSIGVYAKPMAIAANPVTNKVYVVGDNAPGPIVIINGADNTAVFPAVTSGHAQQAKAIAVNPVTNKAYAAFANEIIAIDGATNALTYIPITGAATGDIAVAINTMTNRIFVATSNGTLSVIDGDTSTVVRTVPIAAGAPSLGINPVTGTTYVFGAALQAIPMSAGDVTHTIPLTTTITPLAGNSSTPNGSITMNAASTFSPASLPVRRVYYQIDSTSGAWTAASGSGPFTATFAGLANGAHTIHAFAVDGQDVPLATGAHSDPLVGNIASYTFNVAGAKVTPTVSLASSSNPSVAGQPVTFTASVTGNAGTATGTVTFLEGTTQLCPPVTLSSGSAACTTSALSVGTHSVLADYSGDGNYNDATSSLISQQVDAPRVAANIAVTSSANPSTSGQGVTFTASVTGSAGTATGTVTLRDGSTILCSGATLTSGSATCATGGLSVGSHAITATYSGDAKYQPGTSAALNQVVNSPAKANATVAVASSANPSQAGQQVTFTATVGGSAGTPTGTVEFVDGSTTIAGCAAVALSGGSAACATSALAAGSHAIVARYSGSAAYNAANSTALTQTVTAQQEQQPVVSALSNISTRGQVLTGNDVMIGGFVIGGSASKTVVVRARGPSLADAGVQNTLANPMVQLVRSSDQVTIASNDDWGSAANAAAISASGFAPAHSLEAAILMTLPPGAYTAVVSGVGGGSGIGIVEVFEVDQPEVPLVNISTRGQVRTGEEVMIGGFVVQGSSPQTLVIRARGPSLAAFGVDGAMANPTLRLVRSADQSTVATNDDWGSASNAAAIAASGFAPSDASEAAILVTLDPGAYTAIVSGVAGGTGVAIVEVFSQQ